MVAPLQSSLLSLLPYLALLTLTLPPTLAISGTQSDPSLINGQSFTHIIIGGGLSGLTLANRLSANSSLSILVLEAGQDDRTNENVYDPYRYSAAFDTSLDWAWPAAQGRTIRGGKTLRGSTSINGLAWTRGEKAQYDAWGSKYLGGSELAKQNGWNWDGMFAAMKKAEGFSPPNDNQKRYGPNYVASYHGPIDNPVQVTYPDAIFTGPQQPAFYAVASQNFSIPASIDADGGVAAVVAFRPDTIDWRKGQVRSSSATAYWSPIEGSRSNVVVLVGQTATRLLWSSSKDAKGLPIASGVEFAPSSGGSTRYTAKATREVILSAGAIQSPKLLQLSGVGDPALLRRFGITVIANVTGVGKNLQEQTIDSVGWTPYSYDFGGRGPSNVIAYPSFAKLFGKNASSITTLLNNGLQRYAQDAYNAGAAVTVQAALKLAQIQRDQVLNDNVGVVEYFFDSGFPNGGLGIDLWQLLPFSRGFVSIASADPFTKPTVDPRYFAADVDMEVQIAGCRQARKLFQTGALKQLVSSENAPGFGSVPDNADGGAWGDWYKWIKQGFASVHHPIATCMMATQALGGVVNENLLVYGLSNVRVVDASVLPVQVSAHLSSTLYGMSEIAAQIILTAAQKATGTIPPPPSLSGTQIRFSGTSTGCLTVSGSSISAGSAVSIVTCEPSTGRTDLLTRQLWSITRNAAGPVKLVNSNTNLCLDAGVNPGNNGSPITVYTCYTGANGTPITQQNWYYTGDNHVAITGGSQCLDVARDSAPTAGSPYSTLQKTQTWTCSSNPQQVFTT